MAKTKAKTNTKAKKSTKKLQQTEVVVDETTAKAVETPAPAKTTTAKKEKKTTTKAAAAPATPAKKTTEKKTATKTTEKKTAKKATEKKATKKAATKTTKKTKTVENTEEEGNPGDRHFKLITVDGEEVEKKRGGRYTLPAMTKKGNPNRRGPKDLASKVFSQLCKGNKNVSELRFSIQETTRNSNHKVYTYVGNRIKLDKPQEYTVKDKSNNVRTIKKEFRNVLTAVKKADA